MTWSRRIQSPESDDAYNLLPADLEPYSPRHAGRNETRERKVAAVTGAAVIAFAAVVVSGFVDAKGGPAALVANAKELANTANACPAASEEAKQAVRTLFPTEDEHKESRESSVEVQGLHYFSQIDHDRVEELLVDSKREEPELSIEEYIETANGIDAQFGADFSMPTSNLKEDYLPVMRAQLETNKTLSRTARSAIAQHLLDVTRLPKEYLQYLGTKHVNMVDIQEPKIVGKFDYTTPDSIYIDIAAGPHTTEHEMWHGDEYRKCGGALAVIKDEAFRKINPRNIYIGQVEYLKYLENVESAAIAKGLSRKCYIDYDKKGEGLVAQTYGLTAIEEDKATVVEAFSDDLGLIKIFGTDAPLREKGVELMARMYTANPKLAEHFANEYAAQSDLMRSLYDDAPDTVE